MEKYVNTKIINKHDSEANWLVSDYVPLNAELIIYDIDDTHSYQRFKLGDGETPVNELPFMMNAPMFVGTTSEYEAANTAGLITDGMIVYITDDEDDSEDTLATEEFVENYVGAAVAETVKTTELQVAIDNALAQAKESGEFDGTSVMVESTTSSSVSGGTNTVTFTDGNTLNVKNGSDGNDYVLTDEDKTEIAEQAAQLVEIPDNTSTIDVVAMENINKDDVVYTYKYEREAELLQEQIVDLVPHSSCFKTTDDGSYIATITYTAEESSGTSSGITEYINLNRYRKESNDRYVQYSSISLISWFQSEGIAGGDGDISNILGNISINAISPNGTYVSISSSYYNDYIFKDSVTPTAHITSSMIYGSSIRFSPDERYITYYDDYLYDILNNSYIYPGNSGMLAWDLHNILAGNTNSGCSCYGFDQNNYIYVKSDDTYEYALIDPFNNRVVKTFGTFSSYTAEIVANGSGLLLKNYVGPNNYNYTLHINDQVYTQSATNKFKVAIDGSFVVFAEAVGSPYKVCKLTSSGTFETIGELDQQATASQQVSVSKHGNDHFIYVCSSYIMYIYQVTDSSVICLGYISGIPSSYLYEPTVFYDSNELTVYNYGVSTKPYNEYRASLTRTAELDLCGLFSMAKALSTVTEGNELTVALINTPLSEDAVIDLIAEHGTKIFTGSYTGSNTYGSSNPNVLTFEFAPKFVLIYPDSSSTNSQYNYVGYMIGGASYGVCFNGSTKYPMTLTWSDNSVTWYASTTNYQLNGSKITYRYVAIG